MNYFVLFSSPFFLINRLSIEPRQYLSLVRHKAGCTSTEDSQSRLELSDLESKGVAKTDALISYALTAQLAVPLILHMQKVDFLMTRLK